MREKIVKPYFLFFGILIIVITLVSLYNIALLFAPVTTVAYGGYVIEGKKIAKNLKSEGFENTEKSIQLLKINEQDTIYKKLNNYYIGSDEKKNIDINYPIYINEKTAMLNLSDDIQLVTKDFEKIEGYKNLIITDGSLYNSFDLSKGDSNNYIFIQTKDDTYIAIYNIKVETGTKEYIIPTNSIIYFTEKYITYYRIENDKLIYNNILDVNNNIKITIGDNDTITYENFLKKIGVITENKTEDVKVEEDVKEQEEPVKNEDKKEENTTDENKQSENQEKPETSKEYIKPSLSATEFSVGTYFAKTKLNLYDPQGNIKEATFIIKKGGKIFQRREILSGGDFVLNSLSPETEFEIEGIFQYYNEEKKLLEVSFCKQKVKTKSLNDLDTIVLKHEAGELFSNKIEIKNISIKNEIQEELKKAISKIEIKVSGLTFRFKNSQINDLINNKEVTFQTGESLKSNQRNLEYQIYIYDKFGNNLKTENSVGKALTVKKSPSVQVTLKTKQIDLTELEVKLSNPDNVKLYKIYYVLENEKGDVIKEEINENTKIISRKDLNVNSRYTITFYANYDVEDGKGIVEDDKIGETPFVTASLADLGPATWNTSINKVEEDGIEVEEIWDYKAVLNIKLDTDSTDEKLLHILEYAEVIVKDEKETIVFSKKLEKEEIFSENPILTEIIGLDSNSVYKYDINTYVKQGTSIEKVNKKQTNSEFKTRKKEPIVDIPNMFVTDDLIDFDIRIIDTDESILNEYVKVELRDKTQDDKMIKIENMSTNGEYKRKQYYGLDGGHTYNLKIYAPQYNIGKDNATYEINKVLYEEQIVTEKTISGEINLLQSKESRAGINLVNMRARNNWEVYDKDENLLPTTKPSYYEATNELHFTSNIRTIKRSYLFNLNEYKNEDVTVSFRARKTNSLTENNNIGIQYGIDFKNKITFEELFKATEDEKKIFRNLKITELEEDENGYVYIECEFTIKLDSSGYLGFFVDIKNNARIAALRVKDLQIELR